MVRRRVRGTPPQPAEQAGAMTPSPGAPGQGAAARGPAAAGPAGAAGAVEAVERGEDVIWEDRTRVFLQPIAAPSVLGLFGLAGALMMVGAWQAEWYGNALTPLSLWPFVLMFGGLGQFVAGVFAYRARDGLATAIHGMWGAFWLAFGLLFLLISAGAYPAELVPAIGASNEGFGFWFIVLAVVTGLGAIAALGENLGLTAVLAVLAAGAGFTAAGFWAPSEWSLNVGGYMFVIAAALAIYTAASLMLENSYGRTILPIGKRQRGVPGRRASRPMEYSQGQPGVKIGQ